MSGVLAHLAEGAELEQLLEPSDTYKLKTSRRTATANEVQQYQLAAKEIVNKRLRTQSNKNDDNDLSNPEAFAGRYLKRLVGELAAENLQTRQMTFKNYEWMLPQPQASPEQLASYELIHRCAMLVSDDDIASVIPLERSLASSSPTAQGFSYLYIRSWEFTATELNSLIETMRDSGFDFEELNAWSSVLVMQRTMAADQTGPPSKLFVRYVGICDGPRRPRRPVDRYEEDLRGRKNGILSEFYSVLEERFPFIVRQSNVYMVPGATIPLDSFLSVDDHERLMIQLLNPETLLNRQRGGFFVSYLPPAEDADCFQDMKTDFWARFCSKAKLPPQETQSDIQDHFHDVQVYANAMPAETGTSVVGEYSDNYAATVIKQATPFQYRKTTVIVFLGKDITREEYRSASPFIDAQSRTGQLTRDFLYRLVRSEAQANRRSWSDGAFNPTMSPWCFADLWSWPWHKNKSQAIGFLQTYLGIVKPLVAVAYSGPVNDVTMASFRHHNGMAKVAFTSHVGKPTIRFYLHHEDGSPDEESAFINVPHIHPGKDKYGTQDPRIRRVIDLALQYTFVLGNLALDCLDELKAKGEMQDTSRLELCQQILQRADSLFTSSPSHKRFAESFKQARNDLMQHWTPKIAFDEPAWFQPDDERPRFTAEGLRTIQTLGQAKGVPNTTSRAAQSEELWQMDLPDLHLMEPREEQSKARWLASMNGASEGEYYYLYFLGQLPPDAYSYSLFSNFKPTQAPKNWLSDPAARRKAAIDASHFVHHQLANLDSSNGDTLKFGVNSPLDFLEPGKCHGRRVQVGVTGIFVVKFIDNEGNHLVIQTLCKPAIPTQDSLRYLWFTEHGIDVTDARGQPFRRKLAGNQESKVSIAMPHISAKPDFLKLWRMGCDANGIPTTALKEIPDQEPRQWGKAGIAPLNSSALEEKPTQSRPPNPTDANWLLHEFINRQEHLKDGGIFRTAEKSVFPDSTEDQQNFVAFLQQPEYVNHPFQTWWTKYLGGERASLPAVLAKNLPMVRACVQMRQMRKGDRRKGGKGQGKERFYLLGPPGSALPDPFEKGKGQSCLKESDREFTHTAGVTPSAPDTLSTLAKMKSDNQESNAQSDGGSNAQTGKKRRRIVQPEEAGESPPRRRRIVQPEEMMDIDDQDAYGESEDNDDEYEEGDDDYNDE